MNLSPEAQNEDGCRVIRNNKTSEQEVERTIGDDNVSHIAANLQSLSLLGESAHDLLSFCRMNDADNKNTNREKVTDKIHSYVTSPHRKDPSQRRFIGSLGKLSPIRSRGTKVSVNTRPSTIASDDVGLESVDGKCSPIQSHPRFRPFSFHNGLVKNSYLHGLLPSKAESSRKHKEQSCADAVVKPPRTRTPIRQCLPKAIFSHSRVPTSEYDVTEYSSEIASLPLAPEHEPSNEPHHESELQPTPPPKQEHNDKQVAKDLASSQDRLQVEIVPGYSLRLCGRDESLVAYRNGTVVELPCSSCQSFLYCINIACMVVCPECRSFTVLENVPDQGKDLLGIGLTVEMVAEEVRQ